MDDFYRDLPRWTRTAREGSPSLDLDSLRLVPAIPLTARVPCIGLNYRAHAAEGNLPIPTQPVVFGRYAQSLAASGADVPAIDPQTDWEGELAIVIGSPIFRGDEDAARKAIFGFATFNDVSARTFQLETPQWTMGKNGEASGIVGEIVTRDEAGDPANGFELTTRVNGEVMQRTLTSDMIFTVERIVAHLSKAMRLNPGDIIPTGTPSGVGLARNPPIFLQPGDTVEVSIDRLGRVVNRIVAA
ncbi:fumarylacetoacetate hydrolase family protein [Sphingomonas sp. MG17]|uniref:Fumarylacetoacetate hydrolase family protein n=1 Tax=Sphingomonas tagetis TaxID=2949092 RepID=A0A9X2HML9_9SPHN|nr:fumarylacetoacetate hydrolase family protein [Sphingomonas tagetis]